jgi:NAD(P) transhydrogenase subunit alpha
MMREGQILVSFIWPAQKPGASAGPRGEEATVLAMDSVPRISRAQKLDALVVDGEHRRLSRGDRGAHHFGRFFTGQITAAGKVPPAKVFIIGAGVAGLPRSARPRAGRDRARQRHAARGRRPDHVARRRVRRVDYVEEGTGVGGYAR